MKTTMFATLAVAALCLAGPASGQERARSIFWGCRALQGEAMDACDLKTGQWLFEEQYRQLRRQTGAEPTWQQLDQAAQRNGLFRTLGRRAYMLSRA